MMSCCVHGCKNAAWANSGFGPVCGRHDPVELRDHPPHKWVDGRLEVDQAAVREILTEMAHFPWMPIAADYSVKPSLSFSYVPPPCDVEPSG